MKKTYPGIFLTLEGGERAGKSTLIQGLEKAFKQASFSVLVTREPGGCSLGEKVREILLSPPGKEKISPWAELALFLASRAQHVEEVLLPSLQEGKVILCDRFSDSSIAYQGGARNLGMEVVEKITQKFTQNLTPDLTFYLDIAPQKAFERKAGEKDRIEQEALSFHEKIRSCFLELVKKYPQRICLLDATLSPSKLLEKAWEMVQKKLNLSQIT